MAFKYSSLFLVLNVFVFCESSFVDTLNKCKSDDAECQKNLIQKILAGIGRTGIPELKVPPTDPIELKDITVKVMDVLEISLIEGHAKGIRNCVFDKFEVVFEDGRAFAEVTCDITIKGKYKAFSSSPVIKTFLNGDTVHGEGNGKVKIEKLKLKFDFYFYVQKRNGEFYIKCLSDKTKYDYDVKGKMTFFADSIFVGEVESSKLVVGLLNENWRPLMTSFGKPFMDKAMSFFFNILHDTMNAIPLKYYIADDVSKYARD